MNRSLRRFAALFLAATLAFAQLAVSAYACPVGSPMTSSASAAEVSAPGCPDLGNANLCAEHCAYGSVSSDTPSVALPGLDLAPLPWRVAASPVSALPRAMRDWRLARSMHPPPPILFGTLRI